MVMRPEMLGGCVRADFLEWRTEGGSAKGMEGVERYGDVHFGIFAHVRNSCHRDTEVTRGTPEICVLSASTHSYIFFPYFPSISNIDYVGYVAQCLVRADIAIIRRESSTYGSSRSNRSTCLSEFSH